MSTKQRLKIFGMLTAFAIGIFAFTNFAGAVESWEILGAPLPVPKVKATGYANVNGAEIYYTIHGSGEPLILLHNGLGNTDYWGGQISTLAVKYKVINIATRGHGRSTRDNQPFTYNLMASDILAVMDILSIKKASIVGWGDGGIIGIDMAINNPDRMVKFFAIAANYDPSGLKPTLDTDPTFATFTNKAKADYVRLSKTPNEYDQFEKQMFNMWATQPNYTDQQMKSIRVPTAIVVGEYDEAITMEHTKKMASLIPGAKLVILPKVSHFAAWQKPEALNAAILKFLDK